MRFLAGAVLVLFLAACSKNEPPPAVAPTATEASTAPTEPTVAANPAPPANTPPATPSPPPAPASEPASTSAPVSGETLFAQTCATCHMADGSGVPFLQPPIKGSAWISNPDPQPLLSLVLRGSAVLGEGAKAFENDMAPQSHLTDAEIAALVTYVRGRFASTPPAKPVTPAEVAVARARPGLPE